MKSYLKTKLFGLLSAIAIGVVGSGLWQYVFDPLFSKGTKVILDLATLGVDSFKNDLYQEISTGFHEKASYALYSEFNSLYALSMILFTLILAIKTKELVQRKSEKLKELQSIEEDFEKKLKPTEGRLLEERIEELRQSLQKTKPERLLVVIYAMIVVGIIFF